MSDSKSELLEQIKQRKWFHIIQLDDYATSGKQPKGHVEFLTSAIPENLVGKTVLDIGCADGYYSFLAEKRGAKKILGIDSKQDTDREKNFQLIKKYFNSKAEFMQLDAHNLEQLDEKFDIIFMLGVYYHLEDHLKVFRNLYEKCNEQVIFSGIVLNSPKKICKINLNGFYNMTASYTLASIPYILDVCKRCGFKKTELVGLRNDRMKYKLGWYLYKRGSAVFRAYK